MAEHLETQSQQGETTAVKKWKQSPDKEQLQGKYKAVSE